MIQNLALPPFALSSSFKVMKQRRVEPLQICHNINALKPSLTNKEERIHTRKGIQNNSKSTIAHYISNKTLGFSYRVGVTVTLP